MGKILSRRVSSVLVLGADRDLTGQIHAFMGTMMHRNAIKGNYGVVAHSTGKELLQRNLADSMEAKKALLQDEEMLACFAYAVDLAVTCYRNGGRLYIAGNGGSAADAQHLAAELVVRLAKDRNPLPAEALTVDSSTLTAIGNDYGYEYIFSRQLQAKLQPGDVLVAITTSGNSPNILFALDMCRKRGNKSILLTGRDGGMAAARADLCIIAPGKRTSTIQELHIVLEHSLCEAVEKAIFFS